MTKKIQVSFATLLCLMCIICNVLFIVASGQIAYRVSTNALLESSLYYTDQIVKQTTYTLDQYMQDFQMLMVAYSKNDDLISCVTNGKNMTLEERLLHEHRHMVYLKQIRSIRPEVTSILIVGKNGYLYSDDALGSVKRNYDYKNAPWVQRGMAGRKDGSLDIFTTVVDFYKINTTLYQNRVVTLSIPIFNYADETIGAVFCFLDTKEFHRNFNISDYTELGGIFLINQEQEIVLHSDSDMLGTKLPEEDQIIDASEILDIPSINAMNGNLWLTSPSKYVDAQAVCRISLTNIQQRNTSMLGAILPLLVFCLFFSTALCVLIYFWLHRSLRRLLTELKNVDWQKNSYKPANYHFSEFNQITGQFSKLLENIIFLNNKNYEIKLASQVTQLNALLSQMNPHFLFNTLQMLQTELVYGDRGKADQTIVALSNLLRYSVDHHNIHVKFQEELAFTCDYLNILKFSYDGNLDYDIYIPEEMKELQVPKFSLQPIVENCILHGFAGRPKNGKITIVGELEKDHIEATVIDNGAGMSPEQLEKLRQSLQNTVIEEKKTSIGLSNIHHRIQLLYGSEYGIRISSVEGKFTKVKQLLPLDPNIRLRGNLPDTTAEVITEHREQEEAADGDTFNC